MHAPRVMFLTILGLVGCDQKTSEPLRGALVFTLEDDATAAGASVGYVVEIVRDDGGHEAVASTITSDLEPGLVATDSALTPTLAGTHSLTASATVDGLDERAEATLVVSAGEATTLDLVLAATTSLPTDPVAWTLSAADAWGNPVETAAAEVDGGASLTVGDTTVSGTVAGTWPLGATLGAATDTEALTIQAGAPAVLDLTLSAVNVTPSTHTASVSTIVTITDAWANPLSGDCTLTVDGGAATIIGDTVYFESEGWRSVTATLDGTELSDTEGPVLVDLSDPLLTVESPAHGTWAAAGTTTVSGTASDAGTGIATVAVNGFDAPVADGNWSVEVPSPFGLTLLDTVATDASGFDATDVRATLGGSVLALGEAAPAGMLVRLNEGPGGLDAIAAAAGAPLDEATLLAALPAPIYDDSECRTVLGHEYCVQVTLTITDVRWASSTLTLDPHADGTLTAALTLNDLEADWSASGESLSTPYAETGTATATALTLTVTLEPGLDGGTITIAALDSSTTLTDLDLNLPAWVDTITTTLGVDLDTEVENALANGLADLPDEVADTLEAELADLAVSDRWAIGETIASVTATPAALSVDDDGLTLTMSTIVDLDEWIIDRAPHGSPVYGYGQPTWSGATGAGMGFSDDFVSQVFYAGWGSGAFDLELTDEQMTIEMTSLSGLLPGLSDLVMTSEPLLPPVVVPGDSGRMSLDIGDYLIRLYDGERIEGAEVYRIYLSTRTPMELSEAGGALVTTLDTPVIWFQVDLAPPEADLDDIEASLEFLGPSLHINDNTYIGELALPSLVGFSLTGATTSADGPELGYEVIAGALTAD